MTFLLISAISQFFDAGLHFYWLVQYHNFLMRALVSNANLMSERATNDQEV